MTKERKSTDILILGLSVTGIGLAMELLQRGRDFEILDLQEDHALRGFYRVGPTPLNDHPISGMDFHGHFEQALRNKGKWFHMSSGLEKLEYHGAYTLETLDYIWEAKHIVYAPNGENVIDKRLEAQVLQFVNFHVSFCAWSDAFFFKDEPVAVYGAGNWAVNLALIARQYSDHVTIINPKPALGLAPFMQNELTGKDLEIINNAKLTTVSEDPDFDRILITLQTNGNNRQLPFKVLFMGENLRFSPYTPIFENSSGVQQPLSVEDLNAFDHYALYEKGKRLADSLL